MELFPKELAAYVENHTDKESELLHQINRETHLHVLKPRMLSGHLQGRVLSMFSHMMRPRRILEIGTYTGYSALCMMEGMAADGHLFTIDKNQELKERVAQYFHDSGFQDKISFLLGNAQEIIPSLSETWDMVFIDADKVNYSNYFDLVIEQTRPGGYIIADNVLWSGKVVEDKITDEDTEAIRAYNRKIHEDDRVAHVLLPVRDGLMMARKK